MCLCFLGFHFSNLVFPFLFFLFLIARHTVWRNCPWRHFPSSFVRWLPFPRRDGLLSALTLPFFRRGRRLSRGLLPGPRHRRWRRQQPAPHTSLPLIRPFAFTPLQGETNARPFGTCLLISRRRRHPTRAKPASLYGSSHPPALTRRRRCPSPRVVCGCRTPNIHPGQCSIHV